MIVDLVYGWEVGEDVAAVGGGEGTAMVGVVGRGVVAVDCMGEGSVREEGYQEGKGDVMEIMVVNCRSWDEHVVS